MQNNASLNSLLRNSFADWNPEEFEQQNKLALYYNSKEKKNTYQAIRSDNNITLWGIVDWAATQNSQIPSISIGIKPCLHFRSRSLIMFPELAGDGSNIWDPDPSVRNLDGVPGFCSGWSAWISAVRPSGPRFFLAGKTLITDSTLFHARLLMASWFNLDRTHMSKNLSIFFSRSSYLLAYSC